MSRQRETKEAAARRTLVEFDAQISETAQRTGDPELRGKIEKHLLRLPRQYALDVNFLDDVIAHRDLLSKTERDEKDGTGSGVHCTVREVDIASKGEFETTDAMDADMSYGSTSQANGIDIMRGGSSRHSGSRKGVRAPTFGSSVTLTSLGIDEHSSVGMYEIAVSAGNKPMLLSRISAVLFDVGLNIAEAHVFCTDDGLALDIFIVTGWRRGDAFALGKSIESALNNVEWGDVPTSISQRNGEPASSSGAGSEGRMSNPSGARSNNDAIKIDGGEWELTEKQLVFNEKIASGAFGLLYRGSYCGQEVAIKVLKSSTENGPGVETLREFAQELNILRRVHHKNIIQLIGAITQHETMCLVTEFMHGGSLLQYVQEHAIKLPELIRYALGVAMGLDYLHKINIIHRDIKTANLLLDENHVVKIADFGVARIQPTDGSLMTAETGTYRWMAPEVIAHQQYTEKADVYSYGIMVWELVSSGEVPYPGYTPLQAAVGVVQRGLRPTISPSCHPVIAQVMQYCWLADMNARPRFEQIIALLRNVETPRDQNDGKHGFFDRLRSVSFKSKQSKS
jgi:serine/threonine protein kinase